MNTMPISPGSRARTLSAVRDVAPQSSNTGGWSGLRTWMHAWYRPPLPKASPDPAKVTMTGGWPGAFMNAERTRSGAAQAVIRMLAVAMTATAATRPVPGRALRRAIPVRRVIHLPGWAAAVAVAFALRQYPV